MKKQGQNKKIILGLTGTFGSGKTTVAKFFRSFGAKIIDADKIAHEIIQPGSGVYKEIIRAFGKTIVRQDGTVDRRKLSNIVFGNKGLLRELNQITHPKIIRMIKKKIRSCRKKIIVLDAPLLLEAGLRKLVDKLIVVKINQDKLIKRIQSKTSLNKTDILKRIHSQLPLQDKVRVADFVIDNNGTKDKTRKQAERMRRLLWKN